MNGSGTLVWFRHRHQAGVDRRIEAVVCLGADRHALLGVAAPAHA
jgi:hypothetical protein